MTFLFTDVERSTAAWEDHPQAMARAMRRHHQLLDAAIDAHGGVRVVEQGAGDSVVAAFDHAADGVSAAMAAQQLLAAEPWPEGRAIHVRMAVHTGDVEVADDDTYAGPTMNRCGRLLAAAHGGQVIVSGSTYDLVVDALSHSWAFSDLGTHRLRDLERPMQVFQADAPDDVRTFPPLRTLDGTPNNLPVHLTSFVGREDARQQVRELVERNRLVTVTGSGGCGKTRLSCEIAADVIDRFADGAWIVDLAAVTDEQQVAAATAHVLSVHLQPNRPVVETVIAHLRDRRLLLILDNCEHLLEPSAAMTDAILGGCPHVDVLVTSREPLGLQGEVCWRIPSLTWVQSGSEEVLASEAGRLFVDRLRLVRPSYELGLDDLTAIAAICRRLDGIPLAIELAAARSGSLSPSQIAGELDDRFRLLTGGGRNVLPRQRTLEASVDWSYGLLSPDEQAALRSLSVFAAGFTLPAAEAVLAPATDTRPTAVELVSRLVDKSLVHVLSDHAPLPRYGMLETVRQFASTRLVEGGEAEATRGRHLAYVVDWSAGMHPRLMGAETFAAIAEIDPEFENVRAAVSWAEATGDVLRMAMILGDLFIWFMWRGLTRELGERVRTIEPALVDLPLPVRVRVVRGVGPRLEAAGDPVNDYVHRLTLVLRTAEELGEPSLIADAMATLGTFLAYYTDDPEGLDVLTGAVAVAEQAGDELTQVRAEIMVAIHSLLTGHGRPARRTLIDLEPRARATEDPRLLAEYFAFRAWADVETGDLAGGRRWAAEARATVAPLADINARSAPGDLSIRSSLAVVPSLVEATAALAEGHGDDAATELAMLGEAGLRDGDYRFLPWLMDLSSRLHLAGGRTHRARRRNDVMWNDEPLHHMPMYRTMVRETRALLAWAEGDVAAARDLLADQLADAAAQGNGHATARAHVYLGGLDREAGRHRSAEEHLHDALGVVVELGFDAEVAAVFRELAGLAVDAGRAERAGQLVGAADALDRRLGVSYRLLRQAVHDADRLAASEALDAETWAACLLAGESLSVGDAVALVTRARGERDRPRFGWESLTPTERQVVDLIRRGATNAVIADRLLMGRETVKSHLSSIYRKLDVANRTELAAFAATVEPVTD